MVRCSFIVIVIPLSLYKYAFNFGFLLNAWNYLSEHSNPMNAGNNNSTTALIIHNLLKIITILRHKQRNFEIAQTPSCHIFNAIRNELSLRFLKSRVFFFQAVLIEMATFFSLQKSSFVMIHDLASTINTDDPAQFMYLEWNSIPFNFWRKQKNAMLIYYYQSAITQSNRL